MSDLLGASLTLITVFVFLVISEGLAKMEKISKENARKIIHISVGNVIFFVPLFDTRFLAAGIPFLFVFGNYLLSPLSPVEQLRLRTFKAGHAWGTILYPLSLSIVVYLFFESPWLMVAAFFPVVYGDGFAAVFGPKARSGTFSIRGSSKSLLGTSIVALFSWGSISLSMLLLGYDIGLSILTATVVSLIAPFIELFSPKGTDNLVLPLFLSGILLIISDWLEATANTIDPSLYLIGLGGGLLFGIGGYVSKVLTADGAITGFLITTMMLGIGGPTIGTQLLLFFVLGSGATKLVRKVAASTQDEFEKGGARRDAIQAVAKAGIPAVLSVVLVTTGENIWFYLISGIMSSALVDTMATEVGIATKGYPFRVLTPWRRAKPGDTGVISISGTLGGMGFGLIFAGIVYIVGKTDSMVRIDQSWLGFCVIILLAGTLGMLTDSILGTTIQRQNRCTECDKIVEADIHHNRPTSHHSGLKFFNNDMTNILGSSSGAFWVWLLLLL